MCDISRSKIYREFISGQGGNVSDISRQSNDIFVYYSVCKKKGENCGHTLHDEMKLKNDYDDIKTTVNTLPRLQTFVITFEKTDQENYFHYQRQLENQSMGYPILITFDSNISVTIKEIRDIWELIKPFIPNRYANNININNYSNKKNNNAHNNNNKRLL